MPPKQKYTQESILNAAFEILRHKGIGAVGARQVADELNCSTQPIFSYFKDMDDLKSALLRKAKDIYKSYVDKGLQYDIPFKGVGIQYINFAKREPELFKLLFMANCKSSSDTVLNVDDNMDVILKSVMDNTGYDRETAKKLYLNEWIFTHGIAVLTCFNTVSFTENEISELLSDVYIGFSLKMNMNKDN